jgi:hypothetical protein
VAAHHEAAAAAQPGDLLGGDGAGGDVGVVDDGPDRLAPAAVRGNLVDRGLDTPLDDGEDLFGGAAGRGDLLAQRGFDLAGSGPEVGRAVVVGTASPSSQLSLLEGLYGVPAFLGKAPD